MCGLFVRAISRLLSDVLDGLFQYVRIVELIRQFITLVCRPSPLIGPLLILDATIFIVFVWELVCPSDLGPGTRLEQCGELELELQFHIRVHMGLRVKLEGNVKVQFRSHPTASCIEQF